MENTFHIQWHITDRCNLRCLHCYQDDFSSKSELSLSFLKRVFSNIVGFAENRQQKLVIDITGGEPLLYKEWEKILTIVYQHPAVKRTGIITNGFFLDEERIKFLKNFKHLIIKISAEGVDKEIYELFRGKGNYKTFIEICERLKSSLPENEKILMFTLTKENVREVSYLFDFIKRYNFNAFIVERFIPWGRGKKIGKSLVSIMDWLYILHLLCERCGLDDDISSLLPYRGIMVRQDIKGSYELFGAPCIIGSDGIAVMPDGTVFPCRRFPLKIGNLLEDPLKDIWENSDILNRLRSSTLKGKCKDCRIKHCRGCRALTYSITGDYLEEDPLCPL
ncbi:MAG: radical SAM protein [Candidatus Ratteibacteria bacterium]|nr:radical SAM protein [Candidatus Ratteibacteria bacterium]